MFDLNARVSEWRGELARSDAFRDADLDELEDHLRESIAHLVPGGLSEEEAFLVSSRRLGSARALEAEFEKAPAATALHRGRSSMKRSLRHGAVVAAIAATIVTVVVVRLPDVYESRAIVYIEPARMPESFKAPGQLAPRLGKLVALLREEVLSRESLREIVNDLNLYGVKAAAPGETQAPAGLLGRLFPSFDPIEQARKDIKIDLVKRGTDDYVEIHARARAPDLAAKAVNRVADILAEKNQAHRLCAEKDGKVFVETVLAAAQTRLQDAETNLARYSDAHQESLPANSARLFERIVKVQAELEERKAQVRQSSTTMASLRSQVAALVGDSQGTTETATIEKVQTLVAQIAREGDSLEGLQHGIEDDARALGHLEAVEAEQGPTRIALQKLEEQSHDASTEYKGLTSDLRDIERLLRMEEAGNTDQFRTIEAAEAPLVPSSPNRLALLGLSIAGALGLGTLVAAASALARRRGPPPEGDARVAVA